jgi:hypothetical protein
MAVWFELHGIVRKKPGGGVHDSSSVKALLNFADDDYESEFDEMRRMTQEECVLAMRQGLTLVPNLSQPELLCPPCNPVLLLNVS